MQAPAGGQVDLAPVTVKQQPGTRAAHEAPSLQKGLLQRRFVNGRSRRRREMFLGFADEGAIPPGELAIVIREQVVPCFYDRDETGVPAAWVGRMKLAIGQLTPRFSSSRMVRHYSEQYYFPHE